MADLGKTQSSSSGSENENENENAIHISRSSSHPSYDIFINHRGIDVKKNLASLLYYVLNDIFKLCVFLDREEIRLGSNLPDTLREAIETASVHIAIISESYAESPWCLDELSLMLKSEGNIIPVFYGVQPSDVRWSNNYKPYAAAFKIHEEKNRFSHETLHRWKEALREVSHLNGVIFDPNTGDHGRNLKRIVDIVLKLVKTEVLEIAQYPIGLDEAEKVFTNKISGSWHSSESKYAAVIGIVGSEGVGKTTLAKHLYNKMKSKYDASCFLSDVRQVATKNGLEFLQSKLLQRLVHYDSKIDSTSEGKELLRCRLRGVKVLIILDEIDHVSQLDALLVKDVVECGSLVIITSRHRDVLKSSGISLFHDVNGLNPKDAQELLSWYAFRQPQPRKRYEVLVQKFMIESGGLPLLLKKFGEQLQEKLKWTSLFTQIESGDKDQCLEGRILEAIQEHDKNFKIEC